MSPSDLPVNQASELDANLSNCGTVGCDGPSSVPSTWAIRARIGMSLPRFTSDPYVLELFLFTRFVYGGDHQVLARLTGNIAWAGRLMAMGNGNVDSRVQIRSRFQDMTETGPGSEVTKDIHDDNCGIGIVVSTMPLGICNKWDKGSGLVNQEATLKPGHTYRVGIDLRILVRGQGVPTNPVIPGTFNDILYADFMSPVRTMFEDPGVRASDLWLAVDPDTDEDVTRLQAQVDGLSNRVDELARDQFHQGGGYYGSASTAFVVDHDYALEAITNGTDAIAFSGWAVANGIGVWGHVTGGGGTGVRGEGEGLGVGVYARSDAGAALMVDGKTQFSRSGRTTVAEGRSYVDVDLRQRGGLSATSLPFATLLKYRSGLFVAAVRPDYPAAGRMRIYLNKQAPKATAIAWFVTD